MARTEGWRHTGGRLLVAALPGMVALPTRAMQRVLTVAAFPASGDIVEANPLALADAERLLPCRAYR